MKATRVKWDEGMAARCFERFNMFSGVDEFEYEPAPVKQKKAAVTVPEPQPEISNPIIVDLQAGEWDDFEYALSAALKK